MKTLIGLIVLTLGLTACQQNVFYEKNVSIPSQSWSYDTIPSFQVHVDDNKSKYDVVINLRHNKDYKFSNIFVLLHQKGPELLDTAFRHELILAERDGRWLGKTAGSLYEGQILAKKDFVFPDTGIYTFALEQNMRTNPLVGVTNAGIKVVKKQ